MFVLLWGHTCQCLLLALLHRDHSSWGSGDTMWCQGQLQARQVPFLTVPLLQLLNILLILHMVALCDCIHFPWADTVHAYFWLSCPSQWGTGNLYVFHIHVTLTIPGALGKMMLWPLWLSKPFLTSVAETQHLELHPLPRPVKVYNQSALNKCLFYTSFPLVFWNYSIMSCRALRS